MITLKKPLIIKLKNYTLIYKSKKENIKYYGSNPATVAMWYKMLAGDHK